MDRDQRAWRTRAHDGRRADLSSTPEPIGHSDPVLHLLAGPNGSGKSTLVEKVLGPVTGLPFVNADVIAGASFITETVFSHPSKVDFLRTALAAGYLAHLHVMVIPAELCVARVKERVRYGGHGVPEVKIRERHERLWDQVVEARAIATETTFYDNSRAASPFRVIAHYRTGSLVGRASWPAWAPVTLAGR